MQEPIEVAHISGANSVGRSQSRRLWIISTLASAALDFPSSPQHRATTRFRLNRFQSRVGVFHHHGAMSFILVLLTIPPVTLYF